MNLSDLLKGIDLTTSFVNHEAFNFKVTDATCDSRQVQRNSLFVAIPGVKLYGHNFIEEAISFAINKLARRGDVVVICGKGHERSLCFGETEIPWSDQETVREILKKRSKRVNRCS